MIADCGVPLLGSSFNLTYNFTLEESVAVISCDGRSNVATQSYIIRGEPERAANTRVTYGEFAVRMYVCMYVCMYTYVCSDTSSTCS